MVSSVLPLAPNDALYGLQHPYCVRTSSSILCTASITHTTHCTMNRTLNDTVRRLLIGVFCNLLQCHNANVF